jgi:Leucine-rich repeat (LRR) protein
LVLSSNLKEIPNSIGQLSKLKTLSFLYRNSGLKGSLPPSMGNLTSLESFVAQSSQISGEIPEELGNLVNLHTFVLTPHDTRNGNFISGKVPASFASLTKLARFDVSRNDISGKLPLLSSKLESCGISQADIVCYHKENAACAGAGVQGKLFGQ